MRGAGWAELEARRQQEQLAFLAGGAELEVGSPDVCPLPVEQLEAVRGDEPWVREVFDGGLTARVFRIHAAGRDWTLKKARARAGVHNVDGQTSFLNEIQRRADLMRLKSEPGGVQRFAGIVDTQYASLRRGILLSPWIEGAVAQTWDERSLGQLFEQLVELYLAGLFEWDLCPGNILDDGRQLMLFDFGYMYRFDPLTQFNSAGDGTSEPMFHPVERFETRNFCAWLLEMEQKQGASAALAAFRREKAVALPLYERLCAALAERAARPAMLARFDALATRWRAALRGDAAALYLAENWRAHVLDLSDDLHGQSCTPMTLRRADWLLATLREHFDALVALAALFGPDRGRSQAELLADYQVRRRQAECFQSMHAGGGGASLPA